MATAYSRVTAEWRASVPVNVRRKLGIFPGSILEWAEEGDEIVVRRSAGYTSEDIHRALFGAQAPESRTVDEIKEGIRQRVRKRYTRS